MVADNEQGLGKVLKRGNTKDNCSQKFLQQMDKDFFRFPLLQKFLLAHTSLDAQLFD